MSESWQRVITATLGWVFARWRENKTENKPSLLKRYSHHEYPTVHYRGCVLFCLCRIRVDFHLRTTHAMEYLHVWVHQQREKNKTKQNKKTHTQHTHTHTHTHTHIHTKWDCAPLFCIFCNPDCGNYLPGFTSLVFHSKGSFWNRVTLNSV